ncbi:ABC-F family ATP-binding cassette domain-containing protein [Caulobacter sp. KR2-114]|uniref:ABC-F family ATP-binding cassette domain-containing protein n=1 Tax=Caulobacter sp. KR2-114 TaxID=3400912 RepID=UPI003C052D88
MPSPLSGAFVTLDGVCARSPDGRALFDNLTLSLGAERTGLVGRNGVGKTTLVRLILGELEPAAGAVTVSGRLAVLRQALAPPPGARLEDLLGVGDGLARLARIERGDPREDDLEAADWLLPARLAEALDSLGLADVPLDRPASALSGGQATRAALAALLIAEPDLLIMDEPTNNLDAEGRAAVAALLAGWRGGALVVSHDRALLRGMDRIVELSSLGARVYGGGYDLYADRKAEELAAAARDLDEAERAVARVGREAQQARERQARRDAAGQRARARSDAPKMLLDFRAERAERTGGRQARLAERQRSDAAEVLEAAQARVERLRALGFTLPPSGLAEGKLVLAFEDVGLRWPDGAAVLEGVSFRLTGPRRIAVGGPNGAGKSTLLRLATGALEPTAGRIVRGVPAALLDQQAAALRPDETVLDAFLRLNPGATANSAHAALARFLFRNTAAQKRVGSLSGGERLRAALACALMGETPPRLVILDEPTNHLDLDAVAAVEAALDAYDGALLVVSHDPDFLDAIGVDQMLWLGPDPDQGASGAQG